MNEGDALLQSVIACPRDRKTLPVEKNRAICRDGHEYPVYDGIPVLLLDDVDQTAWWATTSIEKAKQNVAAYPSPSGQNSLAIDPHVQRMVGATSGHLYGPLVGKLKEYPIPELRLPEGDGRLFLDVGCNWGRWSIAAARKGYRVIGIDPSLDGVLAARRVAKQVNSDCSFVVGDARHLPFKSESFDVVFSYSVIQHFSKVDARAALRSIARVLKPGGTCLIQMPNRFGIRSLYHLARRGFAEGKEFDVRYYTVPELKDLFTSVFGNAAVSVDGYFGLGIQASDVHMLPIKYRLIVRTSELLRALSLKITAMRRIADSLYLKSLKKLSVDESV